VGYTGGNVSAEAWLDGDLVPLERAGPSVASSTFHMGSGVFDGLMAYWNHDHWHLHLGSRHFERFCAGCRRMDLAHPWSPAQLEEAALSLLSGCERRTHYLRPIAFKPQPEILLAPSRRLPASICLFAVVAERDRAEPLRAAISPVTRISSDAIPVDWKICGAYANSYLAQVRARSDGFDTAIFLDRRGRVSEAPAANLFLLKGERLVTPALDADVFPGLTRSLLLSLAAELEVPAEVRPVEPAELRSCDGAFLCSTLMEIKPLAALEDRALQTSSLPAYQRLLSAFRSVTHERRSA
jgi:branched-chain amino acid aminotransferase